MMKQNLKKKVLQQSYEINFTIGEDQNDNVNQRKMSQDTDGTKFRRNSISGIDPKWQ